MKKRILSMILTLTMILTLVTPFTVFADESSNTFNGEAISFSDWTACGIGSWEEENGVLKPAEITEFNMLRFNTALGENYTVEMDVKQADLTSGWQTINLAFEVNSGENFTQSGLVLDLHNAGVARVVTWADKDKGDDTPGSYNNPYGGTVGHNPTTDWFHVKITRAGSDYTVIANGATLTFETDAFNGGYLVLGAVGNREVEYKNIAITKVEAVPENTFNGEQIAFEDWSACGIGSWEEENGILKPAEITEFNMLRFGTALGENYTVEMDVKQAALYDGWQTVNIGFEVNPGENFTQSGLVLDLHNAGVARVVTWADKDKGDDTPGSYNNPYGGTVGHNPTTDWFHVKITRAGSDYTVIANGATLTFETDAFNGGYLVLGAVGNREVDYKNVTITVPEAAPVNTYNGEEIPFSDWTNAAFGSWTQEDGVLKPEAPLTDFNLLRFGTALGQEYTVEMDVKQADLYDGWQTINIGFEVNPGENFTQSGLVLDLHNAGVARVITWADKDKGDGSLGSYDNPYGGTVGQTPTTEWFHVSIVRSGSDFTVTANGVTLTFETDAFNGGYLVLGAVGSREVSYKNITITTVEAAPENTLNGEQLPFSAWTNAGFGSWVEEDGVLKPAEITEYTLLRLDYPLGQNYTVDMDVKQAALYDGWQTINIGFDVNMGENFTQSGLVLDMHNAGVCRVITFADKDKGDGTPGSYGNPFGGNGGYSPSTDWAHVKIVRAGSSYTVKVNGTTLSFQTDAFNGGYLVLGAVGNRDISYKNVKITAEEHDFVEDETIAPSCTEDGSTQYVCAVCGQSMMEILPATGHSYVGGVCEYCGEPDPSVVLKIKSAFLRIDEDINVIYTAEIPADCTDPYMVFTFQGRDIKVTDYTEADGKLLFELSKIVPQCMGDNISATLYAKKNGETVTDTVAEYSIRTYCVNQLAETEDAALITLLSDLLTYGAAAQTYTGYKTDAIVTSGLDLAPSTFTALEKQKATFTGEKSEVADWYSATIVLSNDLGLRLTFTAASVDGLSVDVTINGRTQTFTDFTELGDGKYAIIFYGIKATEFDDAVTASFKLNGESIGRTVSYSVNTYISGTQDCGIANLEALVKALYNYGASAAAYAGSEPAEPADDPEPEKAWIAVKTGAVSNEGWQALIP